MKATISIASALVVAACLGGAASLSASASPSRDVPAAAAKKKCKIVKNRVHGKIRKVRVCTKPKPKPTVKSVSLKLDTGNAVSKPIAAANGGTITATAASGTKLTLTVPKDALLADTTVTMTPVTSISGLPKGLRFLGGVQLAPEGTSLGKDATLTVETPAAASAKHVRAIGWEGQGKNPYAYKATRTGSAVRIKVIHFSGVAAEDGEQQWASVALEWLRLTYHQVHDLMVQATTTDSLAFARAAIERWLNWERQAELLGGDDFMAKERRELREVLLPKVIKNAIEKSYERCKSQHDVTDARELLLEMQRQAQLLGLNDLSNLAQRRLEQCLSFELDFESLITWQVANGHGSSRVRVTALKLNAANNLANEAPLDYFGFEFIPDVDIGDCTLSTSIRVDAPFGARITSIQKTGDSAKISMNVTSGGATETQTGTCPNSPPHTITFHLWEYFFIGLHQGSNFTINDWDYVGTSLFARKTYSNSFSDSVGTVTEQTSFELRHTPE